jgi:tRNA A37 threonylcarbamoyladenosine biosynthesis protein TsaE
MFAEIYRTLKKGEHHYDIYRARASHKTKMARYRKFLEKHGGAPNEPPCGKL